MANSVTLNPKGLFTNYNNLSQVEPGALLKANNTVLDEKGILRPRRGIKYYSSLFYTETDRARQLLDYKGRIFRHVNTKLAFDDGTGTFTEFDGDYSDPATNTRIKGQEFKGNFYFTTSDGVKKISVKQAANIAADSITPTGAPIAPGITLTMTNFGVGFLDANQKTGYKVTWGYKDKNGITFEGVPCAAEIVENDTNINNLSINYEILVPPGITTDYFFRLYRCETRDLDSSLSDEYNLVFEGSPTLAEIAFGFLEGTDNLSEDFRLAGLALYSNPNSGQGNTNLNFAPPFATDLALYQNHLFYANTKLPQFKTLTLQKVGDLTNLSNFIVTDTASSQFYNFKGLVEISAITTQPTSFFSDGDYFLLNSANNTKRYFAYIKKTPSVVVPNFPDTQGRIPIEIDLTTVGNATYVASQFALAINAVIDFYASSALNIVTITNVDNGYVDATSDGAGQPTNLVFITPQEGLGEDLLSNQVLLDENVDESVALEKTIHSLVRAINYDPDSKVSALYLGNGKIYLQRRDFSSDPFYTDSTEITDTIAWFPNLSGVNFASEDSKSVNALYFSKQDEPESVPLLNVILVGSSDEPILRIIPLRESLYIFKTDGLYRLSGYDKNSFTTALFDSTAILKAPDSVAVLRNQVYFYGTQGVSRVSEVGIEKLSDPIDDKIIPLISTCSQLDKLTFGIAYETDESYMLWTALKASDTIAQVAYRYNLHTESWVEWKISKTCAVLNKVEDILFFGSGIKNTLEVERKNFDRFDYADREILIDLPSLSMYGSIIKPTGAAQIEAGDVLYQVQYLTMAQYNQIIEMLVTDPSYPVNNFFDFMMEAGQSISVNVSALTGYLNTIDTNPFLDTHGNTAYVFTGSLDFATVQTEWFHIVDRINQSPSFFFSNYPKYDRVTPIEAVVVKRDISNNDIYLTHQYPFIEGPLYVFKSIDTEIEYVPQGDAATLKQFHTCQVIFQNRSINTAEIGFSGDNSSDFEYVQFAPNSAGSWGNFEWGNGAVWGGEGDKAPLRTYVPARKQRGRFLGIRFRHRGALESFLLYGVIVYFNESSDRAYK